MIVARHRSVVSGALSALGLLFAASSAHAAITLTGDAATDLEAKVFLSGLSIPTDLAVLPDGRVIIIQKAGDIAIVVPGQKDPVEERIDVATSSEQGLLGVIPDPNFATNQFVYFYADNPSSQTDRHQILRYKLGADSKLSARTLVVSADLEGPANHDGGGIDIYQGNIYMGVGDTGANASPPKNRYGTCLNKGNGKVLRASLAEATLGEPPADNPLVNVAMVTGCATTNGDFSMMAPQKLIYAWGFRNPFRLWVDKKTGKVWVGDVGEVTREEIDIVQPGKHHGYPFHEGNKDWVNNIQGITGQCMGVSPASECIAPVYDYDRVGMDASVIGGRILDGCDWPAAWTSRYIFGDYNLNKVWTLDVNAARDGVVANSRKDFATAAHLTGIRMGTDNALYLLEEGGNVTRITAKGSTSTANSCPSVNAEPGGNPGGGTGAGGNAAGGGSGAPTTAGTTASGGTGNGSGATSSTGGSSSTAGSSTSSGGSTSTGATGNSAAGSAGAANGDGDSGGCGCQVVGGPVGSKLGLAAALAGLAMVARRRRQR